MLADKNNNIIKRIDSLIFSIENSNIQKIDRLKIIKVLISIKIRLIEFLRGEENIQVKEGNGRDYYNSSEKQEIIINFIKEKGGRVDLFELSKLGIAGRSLRRYLRSLSNNRKIKIQKDGRRHFYELLTI